MIVAAIYIGFRENLYGPLVTTVTAGFLTLILVVAMKKCLLAQPYKKRPMIIITHPKGCWNPSKTKFWFNPRSVIIPMMKKVAKITAGRVVTSGLSLLKFDG